MFPSYYINEGFLESLHAAVYSPAIDLSNSSIMALLTRRFYLPGFPPSKVNIRSTLYLSHLSFNTLSSLDDKRTAQEPIEHLPYHVSEQTFSFPISILKESLSSLVHGQYIVYLRAR